MNLDFLLPDCFAPSERDFQIYCAIKLFKGKYINKEAAVSMCELSSSDSETPEQKFNELLFTFENYYKVKCGRAYTDWEYEEDPEKRE